MNDSPREELCNLTAKYGRELFNDPRRCESLLRDHCGGHRREISILVSAIKDRVPHDLLGSSDTVPTGILFPKLARRLENNFALSREAAWWGVETWALALGLISSAEIQGKTSSENSMAKVPDFLPPKKLQDTILASPPIQIQEPRDIFMPSHRSNSIMSSLLKFAGNWGFPVILVVTIILCVFTYWPRSDQSPTTMPTPSKSTPFSHGYKNAPKNLKETEHPHNESVDELRAKEVEEKRRRAAEADLQLKAKSPSTPTTTSAAINGAVSKNNGLNTGTIQSSHNQNERILEMVFVQKFDVNVRQEPNDDSRIIAQVSYAEHLPVIENSIDGNWAKVKISEFPFVGWINRGFLAQSDPRDAAKYKTESESSNGFSGVERASRGSDTVAKDQNPVRQTNIIGQGNAVSAAAIGDQAQGLVVPPRGMDVDMKEEPSFDSKSLFSIGAGHKVRILAEKGGWMEVSLPEFEGTEYARLKGWVRSEFIVVMGR